MGARGPTSDLRERVQQLATETAYQLPDGSPNKSLIARELDVSRTRVQAILRELAPTT